MIVLYQYENNHDRHLKKKKTDWIREKINSMRNLPLVSFFESFVGRLRGSLFAWNKILNNWKIFSKFKITFHFFSCSIDICESIVQSVHYFIKSNIFLFYLYLSRQVSWLINTSHCHLSLLVDCLIERKKIGKKKSKKKKRHCLKHTDAHIYSVSRCIHAHTLCFIAQTPFSFTQRSYVQW